MKNDQTQSITVKARSLVNLSSYKNGLVKARNKLLNASILCFYLTISENTVIPQFILVKIWNEGWTCPFISSCISLEWKYVCVIFIVTSENLSCNIIESICFCYIYIFVFFTLLKNMWYYEHNALRHFKGYWRGLNT